jgi:hypothetical protein
MKIHRLLPLLLVVLVLTLAGCQGQPLIIVGQAPPAAEEVPYQIEESEVMIPVAARDVEIPASVIVPAGEGPFPLVAMAHGHGGSRDENGGFANIAQELGRHGIASVRMDFPGCGASSESFQLNTLSNMIDDVNASIDYMADNNAIDGEKLGIFGYSMGGRIALAMAADGTRDFDGMVLLAPAVDDMTMVNFLGGQEAWDTYYAEAQANGYADFTTIYGQEQQLSVAWFEDLMESDPIDRAGNYTGNALVIYGEDDPVVSPDVSKATAAALGCPTLDVTGDTHSYSFYSDSPDIRQAILDATVSTFAESFR